MIKNQIPTLNLNNNNNKRLIMSKNNPTKAEKCRITKLSKCDVSTLVGIILRKDAKEKNLSDKVKSICRYLRRAKYGYRKPELFINLTYSFILSSSSSLFILF